MKSITVVIAATRIRVHLREIVVSETSYISTSLGMLSPKTNSFKTNCPIPSEREKHTLFQTKVVKIYIIFSDENHFKDSAIFRMLNRCRLSLLCENDWKLRPVLKVAPFENPRFENAPFLVWMSENKRCPKSVIDCCFHCFRALRCVQYAKKKYKKLAFSHEKALV